MTIKVTTQPPVEPVTLAEVKLHCRIDHDTEDSLLETLMSTARQYCQTITGRAFVEQTIQYDLSGWPYRKHIVLPRPPVVSVTSVTWYDIDGNPNVLTAGTDYLVDADMEPARIFLPAHKTWPTETLYKVHPVRIEYIAGYPKVAEIDYTAEAVGTGDDTTDTFTLANVPIKAGSVDVYIDAVLTTAYTVNLTTGEIVFTAAPATGEVITADYTKEADYRVNVPDYIKSAMLLYINSLYENREAVLPAGHIGRELPKGFDELLWQERVFWTDEMNR